MALAPINPTNLTPPRVEFIDPRSGAISREWYRFFLSLLTATESNQEEVTLGPDTASLLATYDAMLATATQASAITSDGMVASLESSLNNLQNAFGVTPPDLGGTVTSVAASGGTTGLTFTGSPITTSGTLTLGGTLAVANGGTGQTTYTDGQLLIGNTTGNTLTKATLIAGTNISITNGSGSITISSTAGTGTVTSVSVVSANGFAGTVATATTTPAITLSTSVTGLIKGNGTALSAAVAATDYVAPSAYASANGLTMSTSRLLGRTTASTGAAEEISVAGGLTLSAGVLTGASGTVTSVTGTSPVVSSGGTTPAISMPAATTSVNGYLTSTDWTTFNNKGSGTVTSVSGTGTVNGITLTGTVTTSGSLTLGGTLSGVSLTTQVSGTLPIANGGTNGTSTPTAGAVPYGTGTAYAFTAAGTSGQVLTSAGAGVPTWTTPTTGTVTSVSGTGTVNGITLTGTVTSSGSLTLGGTLSNVNLTTQVTGTLPVANGGTGTATAFTTGSVVFAGASGVYTQDNANLFWDDTNNRLGVGTASPAYTFDVSGIARAFENASAGTSNLVSANTSTANNTTKYTSLLFQGVDTIGTLKNSGFVLVGPGDANYVSSYMAFFTRISDATAERMRIDTSGNLLVGTTVVEAGGRICSVSTTSGNACVSYRNTAGASSIFAYFINAANSAIIGSITNNANTGTLYNITSDVRLKENISDADDAASLIDALQVRKFDWKDSISHQRYGFIAQELLEVAPEAVYQPEDPEDMMGVDYSKLVPMLVKELQSLRARVAQLEGE
jgi:hypothetical protein